MNSESKLLNVIAVLPVTDYGAATSWYTTLLGRGPDVEPDEGVAEWQIAENAWIQVSADPASAGRSTVVIGVSDIEAHVAACQVAGVATEEINDYGFIKMSNVTDPAGNTIMFVQDLS
jgi:hypothetical protein